MNVNFEINNRNFINFGDCIIDLYDIKCIDHEGDEKDLTIWFKSTGFKIIRFDDKELMIKAFNEIWELLSNN